MVACTHCALQCCCQFETAFCTPGRAITCGSASFDLQLQGLSSLLQTGSSQLDQDHLFGQLDSQNSGQLPFTTFSEGRMGVLQSAKAAIGASTVQIVCQTLAQKYFQFGSKPCTHLHYHGRFVALDVYTGDIGQEPKTMEINRIIILHIPTLPLTTMFEDYFGLFEWEMELRGFEISFTRVYRAYTCTVFQFRLQPIQKPRG